MRSIYENQHSGLTNKFLGADTNKTFERRAYNKNWKVDESNFTSSIHERFKDDPQNPIYIALLIEEQRTEMARKYKRTTARETFADNHYDPLFYDP